MAALRPLNLRFSARARAQLLSIQSYIGERNPAAALRVGGAIREAAGTLRFFPEAGRQGRSPGTREWVVRSLPYILVYEVLPGEPQVVMILGVFHGAQNRPSDQDDG